MADETQGDLNIDTIDEAWENAELTEEKEEAEAKQEETVEAEVEAKEEETVAEAEQEENKVDWVSLGFEKFEGLTDKEVVERIKSDRQNLGHTVNLLGDLRRREEELKREIEELKKSKEEKKDVLSSIPELDDADTAKFNAMYDKNPIKAIMTYGGESIKQMVADAVREQMPKGSIEDVKAEIAYSTFINTVKPTEIEVEQMKILDKEEYLGKQARSYEDLYGLAKMWLNKEQGAEEIYNLMKKHPTLSFNEVHGFIVKPEPKKQVDKEKIKETINKNKKADSHPQKVSIAIPSKDKSFDEAWDDA